MKRIYLSLVMVAVMLLGGCLVNSSAMATIGNICDDGNIPDDLKETAGCNVEEDKTVMPMAVYLIDVVLSIVGVIAVGVIIYGGITYIISTGDAAKLNRAKNSILYGVIGLVIAMLAYAIVYFVSQSIWGQV